jgi:hypothetical protein
LIVLWIIRDKEGNVMIVFVHLRLWDMDDVVSDALHVLTELLTLEQ